MKKISSVIFSFIFAASAFAQNRVVSVSPDSAIQGTPNVTLTIHVAGAPLSIDSQYTVILSWVSTLVFANGPATVINDTVLTAVFNIPYPMVNYNVAVSTHTVTYNGLGLFKVVAGHTGISEASSDGFSVYPQPTSTLLHIMTAENGAAISDIALSTLAGQPILRQTAYDGGKETIDVSYVAAGIYLLSITSSDGSLVCHKVVIE